ncbi:MAG TPA: PAS domain-containing sensor histidine kinase [Longimicrobium sp.]|nr:PAS domain-containing sensor histidine kinase [Longimicrobium sp.]
MTPEALSGAPGSAVAVSPEGWPEQREREAAWRRGREHAARDPHVGAAHPAVAARAFAALAENVRDYAIFLMDTGGVITFWGEGARLMKWWTKEEAEGGHLRLLYPPGGAEDGTAEAHLAEAAERGEYTGEGQRVRSDGSTFWAGVTLTALFDGDGAPLGFAKVTRDLTARRAAEAAMRAANEAAEEAFRAAEAARTQSDEANQAKSLFLATMSHEIRTPLNAVIGYSDLLDLEIAGPLTDLQRSQLRRIRGSSMHLLGIIDEVLDFSRVEAGRVEVDRSAVRLARPIEAALQMVQVQAAHRRLQLTDAVSRLAADVPCWGDEGRVRQILVVLLSNAIKFTAPGGRITVSAGTAARPSPDAQLRGPGPWAYVRVEDTGHGIPAGRLSAIFEPFEQADMALTRQHGGTGLGLTIARRLARLMGGDLTVRSEVGTGTAFFLWLAAAPEEALTSALSRGGHVDPPGPGVFLEVRDVIFAELERLLHVYVGRLRSDPATPPAPTRSASRSWRTTWPPSSPISPPPSPPWTSRRATTWRRRWTAPRSSARWATAMGSSASASAGGSLSWRATSRSCARSSPPPSAAASTASARTRWKRRSAR